MYLSHNPRMSKSTRTTASNRVIRNELEGSLIPAVLTYCRRHALFSAGETAVVAVSGGPDSLCLLHCMHALAPELAVRLHVAHVHHGLRGADADADAAFVEAHAADLGLPVTVLYLDPDQLHHRGRLSLEAAARQTRYAALRRLAKALGGACVVLGHTEDDQAETLLLNLLRGSGIDGLAGMRPRRGDLVRPLLAQSRRAVLNHCRQYGLEPRQDRTNHSRAYRRNALRHDVMPMLRQWNQQLSATLARCAQNLAIDADYLRAEAEQALANLQLNTDGSSLDLSLDRFRELPLALRCHVLRLALEQVAGTADAITRQHVESIDALARSGRAGRRWQLPHALRVEVAGNRLQFKRADLMVEAPASVELPVPGSAIFGSWQITASGAQALDAVLLAQIRKPGSQFEAWCDYTAIGEPLVVRARLQGDRLRPLGLGGSRKLQDVFVDRKVPRTERDRIPIVTGPHGIVWVPGCALDQHAAVAADTAQVVRIQATHFA